MHCQSHWWVLCNCYEINTLVLNVRWIVILDTYLYYNTSTIMWLFMLLLHGRAEQIPLL